MTVNEKIKHRIINRLDHLSSRKLKTVEEFVDQLDLESNPEKKIISFAGVWKDFDQNFIDEMTVNLPKNRLAGNRRIL